MPLPLETVREQFAAVTPGDELERRHLADALAWLEGTGDIYRRARPSTPPKHLVSYAVLLDPRDASVFLVEHILAGLHLPPGGHVEPGESPVATVRREAREELAVEADFSIAGRRPVFVTVTQTRALRGRHTDVSLWYLISGTPQTAVALDPREFTGGRWWTAPEIAAASPALFDPHFGRFLAKVRPMLRP